jgi:signal transduction histidine kinase
MEPMRTRQALAIGSVTLAAAALLALLLGESPGGTATIVLLAAGGAVLASAVGAALLSRARRRSLRVQAVLVAMMPLAATLVSVGGASAVMFLSPHDLRVLVVILAASGPVGVLAALVLGDRLQVGSRSLGELAAQIDEGPGTGADPPLALELAELRAELEDASNRVRQAKAREEALDRSRRELVRWVSHDLRTPLADIRVLVEALEDGVAAEAATVARYHRTIGRRTDELTRLVDDLFELSRIHAGAMPVDMARVSLADLVSDALATAIPGAEARGVEIHGGVAEESLLVDVSTVDVTRALGNLLDNAVRNTAAPGAVEVRVLREGGAGLVVVSDECGGIPERHLSRLFEVGYQGDEARSDHPGGGLGLAIARGLVELHGGTITVRNHGRGCRFTLQLPLSLVQE